MTTETKVTEILEEVNGLLSTVHVYGDDGAFGEMQYDLLNTAFGELIASAWFAQCDIARKKSLFQQYSCLVSVLTDLGDFSRKYEEGLKLSAIAIEEKEQSI